MPRNLHPFPIENCVQRGRALCSNSAALLAGIARAVVASCGRFLAPAMSGQKSLRGFRCGPSRRHSTARFLLPKLIQFRWMSCCIFLALASCSKEKIPSCSLSPGLYSFASFPIGVAIDLNQLQNNLEYRGLVISQFNRISPENCFKADAIHPFPASFNWEQPDSLVAFCKAYSKQIHGHTLIWHQQLPQWIETYSGSTQEWELLMKSHIQTIVNRYKSSIKAWDVVNEAFNEDGTFRNSIWFQKLGSSYIEKAFRFAHEANPNALLFYNDYNLESNPVKLKSVIQLLSQLKLRGVPVYGLGMQCHISWNAPSPNQLASAFQQVQSSGFPIHISELDVSINPENQATFPKEERLQAQAKQVASLLVHYRQLPEKLQYGISFWGVSDANSWIPAYYNRIDFPLLFDADFQPKPMYCKFKNNLQ